MRKLAIGLTHSRPRLVIRATSMIEEAKRWASTCILPWVM